MSNVISKYYGVDEAFRDGDKDSLFFLATELGLSVAKFQIETMVMEDTGIKKYMNAGEGENIFCVIPSIRYEAVLSNVARGIAKVRITMDVTCNAGIAPEIIDAFERVHGPVRTKDNGLVSKAHIKQKMFETMEKAIDIPVGLFFIRLLEEVGPYKAMPTTIVDMTDANRVFKEILYGK